MKTYSAFAGVYDRLMEDAPYKMWVDWLTQVFQKQCESSPVILDVGCGTGTILYSLLQAGYNAHGLDMSEDMLSIAKAKTEQEGHKPLLLHQDMRNIQAGGNYDSIVVLCDSLNYLLEENDVRTAFQSFYTHLNEGGTLIFDVHSLDYVENVLHDFSFADAADDVSYIWNSFPTEEKGEVEHELSFFIKQQKGHYERHDELHVQKTFPITVYQTFLEEAGFDVTGIYADFSFEEPVENSERIFFVAKKDCTNSKKEVN
ncbi:class I SAM-dependent methyltransferase [Salibacterium salarium]|uniref:Class I SAM-dependent methyltransferase n=1 Tax=Salibacterium salarium TaxID=284579 RepID=A0A428N7V3_9BACI|nr:class I SAM-dependent methyltransferase [Salibacterium salarium]RSL34457.1 class I SAM-dependent methyltransferase [Salibacterium salarium]